MMMKLTTAKTFTLASLLAVSLPSAMLVTSASPAFAASAIDSLDTDKDGTVDLAEAKAAASALFDKLDVDHDGTLDRKELKDRISAADGRLLTRTTTRRSARMSISPSSKSLSSAPTRTTTGRSRPRKLRLLPDVRCYAC
jgi:hypothetical protein